MQTTLLTDLTVKEICEGFVYNQLEGPNISATSFMRIITERRK